MTKGSVAFGIGLLVVGGLAYYKIRGAMRELDCPHYDKGMDIEDLEYKGVKYQVARFNDTYRGKGWSFRFVDGLPNFAHGSTCWAGLTDTKEMTIGSAQLTIDTVGK